MVHAVTVLPIAACVALPALNASAADPTAPYLVSSVSGARQQPSTAATPPLDDMRRALTEQMRRLDEQSRLIEAQQRQLESQRRDLEAQQRQLESLQRLVQLPAASLVDLRAAGTPSGGAAATAANDRRVAQTSQPAQPAGGSGTATQPSSTQPSSTATSTSEDTPSDEDDTRLQEALAEVGRVLTRKGTLVIEPEFQYSHNTANQFFYNGIQIIPGIQIGLIEINENDRNTFTGSLGLRYGITNRIEADVKVPYVYNNEDSTSRVLNQGNPNRVTSSSVNNYGLGDIEFGGHYQINRGLDGWPFFVGAIRVKTPTGEGPFDINPEESAVTGSGFWAVEPSLSVIYPTDPAVLYANIGYTYSFGSDVDSVQNNTQFTHVDPGGVLRTSFGVGIGLNERLSTNLGFKYDWVLGSSFTQRPADTPNAPLQTATSDDFQVGAFQFGLSYKVTEQIPVIVGVSVGATNEAPDAEVTIRVPVPIQLFDY